MHPVISESYWKPDNLARDWIVFLAMVAGFSLLFIILFVVLLGVIATWLF